MKKEIEGTEEAEAKQRKRKNMISSRASAARSRANKQHLKYLEEEVEALKDENAHMKELILIEEEMEKTAKKLKPEN
ncbi:hypothetical protein Patl1_30406 [Pistacia atlantica]|uniref:Uncharacterized protein n=1 Tax=Pistacia atlantica TaxID=434234 RepID=A0ACC1ADF4_9ROSI|nr:hypothetical protein Patl1_30406 [Pistacia atlantica]